MDRWRRFREWVTWEFGRPIEVTLAIRLITIERFFKAVVLLGGGIALLLLSSRTDMHRLVEHIQNQLDLGADRSLWKKAVLDTLRKFGKFSTTQVDAVAVGAMLYGCLEAFEGFGLLLRRRWAEYVVLLATAAFLPLEIFELVDHPTLFKAGALIVNVAIVVYLVWRKRLFLERPGHEAADRT